MTAGKMTVQVMLVFAVGTLIVGGCSELGVVNERQMTIDEIITLAESGAGSAVIERQIQATRSKFELTSDEIVALKKAGVDDSVIESMIDSGDHPEYFDWERGYSPYGYWSEYYDSWYPVSTYPPGYPYMYGAPYTVYRRSGLIGRFYRYGPPAPYLHDRRRDAGLNSRDRRDGESAPEDGDGE